MLRLFNKIWGLVFKKADRFIPLLLHKDWRTRKFALESLIRTDPSFAFREKLRPNVPDFIADLQGPDSNIRENAAEVLGLIGDDRATVPLIQAFRNGHIVGQSAETISGRIDSSFFPSEGTRESIFDYVDALRSGKRHVRRFFIDKLGTLGDERTIRPIIAAMIEHEFEDVRKSAGKALKLILSRNAPYLKNFPHLFCRKCRRRPHEKKYVLPSLQFVSVAVCPACDVSRHSYIWVRHVVGVIGGEIEDIEADRDTVKVSLWSESKKTARYADIDSLMVLAGGVDSFHHAVNAVILEFVSAKHSKVRLKQTICQVKKNADLPTGTMNMLRDHFKTVRLVE